jgi:hypothetical protein
MAAQEQHVQATPEQRQHVQQAAANPGLLAKNNGGRPSIAATPRPSAFNAPGAVGAHGAAQPPPHAQAAAAPGAAGHGAAQPPPHAQAAAYTNHNGNGAGHGAAAAHANGQGGGAYSKPPAQKANAKPHPKAPPKGEEKTAQR